MTNDYTPLTTDEARERVEQILDAAGVSYTARYVRETVKDGDWKCDQWGAAFTKGDGRKAHEEFYFYTGLGLRAEPSTAALILAKRDLPGLTQNDINRRTMYGRRYLAKVEKLRCRKPLTPQTCSIVWCLTAARQNRVSLTGVLNMDMMRIPARHCASMKSASRVPTSCAGYLLMRRLKPSGKLCKTIDSIVQLPKHSHILKHRSRLKPENIMTREATNKLLEIANDSDDVDFLRSLLRDVLTYMSEDEVRDFAEAEGYIEEEEEQFEFEDEDEVNDEFEEQHADTLDWSDLPAVRFAFSCFVDSLHRDGRISDELAQNVTLRNDD